MSIEELRRLEQAATPGPWGTHHRDDVDWLTRSTQARGKGREDHEPGSLAGPTWPKEQHPSFCSGWPHRNARADAELIASARNSLPALLDIAEAARDVSDWAERQKHTPVLTRPLMDRLAAALSRLDGGA